MQWGIAFKIPSDDEACLARFPLPTVRLRYETIDGPSPYVTFMYLFKHAPQGWREMQRVAGIKVQMKQLIPSIVFVEEPVTIHEEMDIGRMYTSSEIGRSFSKYIEYPKPWYPQNQDEYMSRLVIYAMKLYYADLYHFESVLAMAIFFNEKIGSPYSRRKVLKKAVSVTRLDKSNWKRKLDAEALHQAHVSGGKIRGEKISEEAAKRMALVSSLLPLYEKNKKGTYDVKAIAEISELSKSTIYSIIKKLRDAGEIQ